jgi:hypothetical protein
VAYNGGRTEYGAYLDAFQSGLKRALRMSGKICRKQ